MTEEYESFLRYCYYIDKPRRLILLSYLLSLPYTMAKFITGKELEDCICDIVWEAKEKLIILSPYIKLDDYFKDKIFSNHLRNPKLHIVIVFGKNEDDVKRSLNKQDFDYFKDFLNVSIVFAPNLHAKYYGNEKKGVITSINLYDYSFKNNIEFGVYSEITMINQFLPGSTLDNEAWNKSWDIAFENEAVFIKRPVYEKKMLSILGKNYTGSEVLLDKTDKFYSKRYVKDNTIKTLNDFPDEIEMGSSQAVRPTREEVEQSPKMGYCIRTGEQIPFNPKRPLSDTAYRSWSKFSNPHYPEKYCHKTGKESYGKTSFKNPILQ